jgi:hypothetical protein
MCERPTAEVGPMAISINDDIMILEVDGTVLATARRRSDDWWEVSHY